jgi:hypothetical protein
MGVCFSGMLKTLSNLTPLAQDTEEAREVR